MDKRTRNLTALGLLTVVATILFVWGLYWMLGTPVLRSGMDLYVILENGGGLKRSDRVQLQGVQVGIVREVRLYPEGGVIVDVRLDEEDYALPTDTRAAVRADVFGAGTIELLPGNAALNLSDGDTIRGGATPQLGQIASDLSTRVESVLLRADALLAPDAVGDLHATAAELPATANQLRASLAELQRAAAALRRTAENVESAEAGPALRSALAEVENSARALTAAAGTMETSLNSFSDVMAKINSGSGTLGRLVNDGTAYDEWNNTLREIRALATDMRERPSRYLNIRVF